VPRGGKRRGGSGRAAPCGGVWGGVGDRGKKGAGPVPEQQCRFLI
jgi:hypothetical protein